MSINTLLERVDFDVVVPQSNHFEIVDEELVLPQEVGWLHDPPAAYSEAAVPVRALLALQAARYAEIVAHDRDLARTELAAAMATEELSERDEDYLLVEAAWQVREGARKEIKVAAIASLGTLGEAETLPFLVQMMGDADAQIAAAAKAAVDKINSKPPDKK